MGTLKTTLKVESTDLFPTPVSFTVVNNNTVSGTFNGFNTVTLTSSASTLNLATIDGTGASAYLYAQAPATNGTAISIGYAGQDAIAGNTGTLVYLSPGDVAFVPVGVGATAANVIAKTSGGTATLYFFLGEK